LALPKRTNFIGSVIREWLSVSYLYREDVFTPIHTGRFVAKEISVKICNAIKEIQGSNDPEVFVKKLLKDTLKWPIEIDELEEFDFDDLGYDWNSELEAMGLRSDEGIQDLFQIAKFPGWPLGMFVVRFGSNSIFTKGRGMTTPLRNLLRNLIEKVRPTASHQTWSQDQLLFMCHHEHEYFQFARFTNVEGKNLPKLQTFGWGPSDPIRTLCEFNLKHLEYKPGLDYTEAIENIERAFDVQSVTKQFYSDYKSAFANFKSELLEHAGCDDDDEIHRYVQLVFNRFLFLRFIEKKGWLRFGDDGNYLRNLYKSFVDRSLAFYQSGFLPMALKGLVEPGKQKSDVYGEVELIGGGLFEASKFDSKFSNLPNEMFSPIIGASGLLYRYNFTVQESTPLDVQVAIDPEMIGTMFEELVTDRDGKGAFYTPRVVVSYMCKEGIKSVLGDKTDVDEEKISQLVDNENTTSISIQDAKEIREALDGIKAIDPACGSGAYLLGLLQELIKIHENLQTLSSEFDRSKYDLKLHIISRSIFGADIDPFATQIAMVRLWLSLAVESEYPVQLPNLDFNIETGDSLLAPDPSQVDWFRGDLYQQADRLAEKKEIYLSAKTNIESLRKDIKNEEREIRSKLRKNIDFPESVDFRIHFAGVFSKNKGFDLVLANPPYVRQEDIKPSAYKQRLFSNYDIGKIKPITKKSDLYCYFYIRGFQLLRPGGHHIFICSNTWLDVGFGAPLQNSIGSRFKINLILDSAVERQFSSADVNTIISFIEKSKPSESNEISFTSLQSGFEESILRDGLQKTFRKNQQQLISEGFENTKYLGSKWSNYLRAPDIYWKIVDQHYDSFVKLKDISSVSRGITSGCDEFFYLNRQEIDNWQIEKRYLKKLMKSSTESKNTIPKESELTLSVFDCTESKGRLSGTNALKYIQWGEEQQFHKRTTFNSRKRWYSLKERASPDLILPKSINQIYRVFKNEMNVIVHQRLYECNLFESYSKDLIHSLLNSTLVSFMLELNARTGLGQGLLDMTVYEVANVLIPNPAMFNDLPKIDREIGLLDEEFCSPDRLELDKIIFDKIGLSESEVIQLYESYRNVVYNRLGRSTTITNS